MKHTIEQWNKKGYRVKRGQHAHSRNTDGECLFDKSQVWHLDSSRDTCTDPDYHRDIWSGESENSYAGICAEFHQSDHGY